MEPIRVQTSESSLEHLDLEKNPDPSGMFYIPNEQYHAGPGLSRSNIQTLSEKTPHHYLHDKKNKRAPSAAMVFGTRFHTILLEHDKFFEKYMKSPDFVKMFGPMQSSKNRAKRDAWLADNAEGKEMVDENDWYKLNMMMTACANSPIVQNLLKDGMSEPSIYWKKDGVLCKCRPDYLRDDGIIVDIKTAADASLEGFKKSVGNYRYDLQDCFYRAGVAAHTGKKDGQFIMIVIENQAPFDVAEYVLDPIWHDCSEMDITSGLQKYKEAVANKIFTGYPQKIQNITPPKWFVSRYR